MPAPARPPAPDGWYYASGTEPVGPFSADQMRGLVRSGTLGPSATVWHETLPGWTPAADVFADRAVRPPPPVVGSPAGLLGRPSVRTGLSLAGLVVAALAVTALLADVRERGRAEARAAEAPLADPAPPERAGTVAASRDRPAAPADCDAAVIAAGGMEWVVGPDRDTSWPEARRWASGLTSCGGGWRLPSAPELAALFDPGATAGTGHAEGGRRWPARLPAAFEAIGGGSWVWARPSPSGGRAVAFNFNQGVRVELPADGWGYSVRAFAVRAGPSR